MIDPRSQAEELADSAEGLPYGATQIALLEEAVQLADSVNDVDLAFELREKLMHAATFGGRHDILLVAFSWCLAMYDRHPGRFDRDTVLWDYKWAVENAVEFSSVSRARLEELLGDFERRYRDAGLSMHTVALLRCKMMMAFGERDLAREAYAAACKYRRDSLSDCEACVISDHCRYHRYQRKWEQSVDAALPVLHGRFRCAEEPHFTYSSVLLPLFHLGRLDEAKEYQRRGYRLVGNESQFVRQHAEHLEFLVLTGSKARSKTMLERHLPHALECVSGTAKFAFLRSARFWTDRMLKQGTRRLKMRLPSELPAPAADGKSDLGELADWFMLQAQELARSFDHRNGTDRFQLQLDELPELLERVVE